MQGKFQFDVGTAGSIPLILQALMPCIAFAPSQVELKLTGGTDVKWSPSIDYVSLVMLPALRLMGYHTNLVLNQRGYYPKGGGMVTFSAAPVKKLRAITLIKRDQLNSIGGISHCVKLESHVAQRQSDAANRILTEKGYREIRVTLESHPTNSTSQLGPGSGITLVANHANGSTLGADSLGERGKTAEKVGEEAAKKLIEELESEAAFDRHMGDILVPYIAVADGHSEIAVSRITMHTLTNIHVVETLLNVKFQVNGNIGECGTIAVNGSGLTV
jgi:RNA 3'-terminal phosphate cyclase (ATP)